VTMSSVSEVEAAAQQFNGYVRIYFSTLLYLRLLNMNSLRTSFILSCWYAFVFWCVCLMCLCCSMFL